ncbi:Aste57867_11281 [Aphanomyces stellatus]|uniref:Proteasome assembly chaperone 1 n=1 Tax=Aphanomyces stellatus TaxID=120398 RepID=A0A485KSW8_9STRA|nr:hypothetical protein As57867_011239 [Aphanomyces stellatus]VFT88143.1 Aste57867_11281 [Aphanomyces stellatus]
MALQLRYPEEADFHSRSALDVTCHSTPPKITSAFVRWSHDVRRQHSNNGNISFTPNRLIIAAGPSASHLMEKIVAHTPESRVIGTIVLSTSKIVNTKFDSSPSAVCSIVSLSHESLAVISPGDIEENSTWEWIDAVMGSIHSQNVISLSTLMSVTFDEELHEVCSLQKLCTTSQGGEEKEVPVLALPRFITGVPAALLTYCEIRQKRCSAFVSLHHTSSTTAQIIKAFGPILHLVGVESTKPLDTYASSMNEVKSFEDLYI